MLAETHRSRLAGSTEQNPTKNLRSRRAHSGCGLFDNRARKAPATAREMRKTLEQHFAVLCANDPNALGLHHEDRRQCASRYSLFSYGRPTRDRAFSLDGGGYRPPTRPGYCLVAWPDGEWRGQLRARNSAPCLGAPASSRRAGADPSVKSEYGRALELAEALGRQKTGTSRMGANDLPPAARRDARDRDRRLSCSGACGT